MAGFEATFALFSKYKFNYGPTEISYIFISMGIVGVIFQSTIIGRVIKNFGETKTMNFGFLISAIGYFFITHAHGLPSLILCGSLAGIGQGFSRSSMASLISKKSNENGLGMSMGVMQSFDSLGRVLGPVFGGLLFQIDYIYPYISSGMINLAFGLFAIFL